jgi:hypothetical protein
MPPLLHGLTAMQNKGHFGLNNIYLQVMGCFLNSLCTSRA